MNTSSVLLSRSTLNLGVCTLALVTLLSGAVGCDGCGAKDQPEDTGAEEEPDTQPQEKDTVDMEKAREEAESAAELAGVNRSDLARIVAGNIEGAQQPDEPSGRVRPERLETGGSIDPTQLKEVFRTNHSQAQKCYERALKQDSNLKGTVNLQLTIAQDGSVARANAQGRSLRSESVNGCLEDAARGWEFPKPEGGAVKVNKPFQFSPKK